MNYGYDSVKAFSKEGIAEEASKLLRQLTEEREERDKVRIVKDEGLICTVTDCLQDLFRAIVFVCHDIGGAIVKQVITVIF